LPPKASFSNYGSWVSAYAPGVDVLGPGLPIDRAAEADDPTTTTWGWCRWSGTSFAAATVTGLLAQALTQAPSLTGAQARERVIRGPRVPIAGLREEDWRPYLHGRHSTWGAAPEADQRR
jgi:subtilisin family serine protease